MSKPGSAYHSQIVNAKRGGRESTWKQSNKNKRRRGDEHEKRSRTSSTEAIARVALAKEMGEFDRRGPRKGKGHGNEQNRESGSQMGLVSEHHRRAMNERGHGFSDALGDMQIQQDLAMEDVVDHMVTAGYNCLFLRLQKVPYCT